MGLPTSPTAEAALTAMSESDGGDGRNGGRGSGSARALRLAAIVARLVARAVEGRADLPEFHESDWRAHVALESAMAAAPAGEGGVWVGTDSGELVRCDANGEAYERHAPDGVSGRPVSEVAVGDDGTVWAASAHSSLLEDEEALAVVRFDGGRWTGWAGGEVGLPSARVGSLGG